MNCLSVHVTDLCNSKCNFCVVGSPFYSRDSINYDDVETFLNHNSGGEFSVVNIHGGEPTIHPKFFELLSTIRALRFAEIHLQTNGVNLAKPEFARRCVNAGVSKFIISLHGHTASLHESQTQHTGGFSRTIDGIREVKSLGGHVRTNTVITQANADALTDIATLVVDLGVDHLNFSALHPVGSARLSRPVIMPQFSHVMPGVAACVDIARTAERPVTLEGFPHCTLDQFGCTPYVLENEYRKVRMLIRGQVLDDYDRFMHDQMRQKGDVCKDCQSGAVCGGVYPEYVEFFGWSEFGTAERREYFVG